MAFLHARGLYAAPEELDDALLSAVREIAALYHPAPGDEGLTEAELAVVTAGGADAKVRGTKARRDVGGTADALGGTVAAYAAILKTGLSTQQAARRLRVSDARVRQRLGERTLLGARYGRAWSLPLFQFAPRGELPGWAEVCAALPRSVSPVVLESWMRLAHPDLAVGSDEKPISPREWLLEGRPAAAVAALTEELA